MAKLQISLDDELKKRIDDYAEKNYLSRSGVISLACTQFLNANESIVMIKELTLAMQKIADTKTLDNDTIEQLKDFERLAKYIGGAN